MPRLIIHADRGQNEYLSNEVDIERASDANDDYDDDIDDDYDEPIEDEIGRYTLASRHSPTYRNNNNKNNNNNNNIFYFCSIWALCTLI